MKELNWAQIERLAKQKFEISCFRAGQKAIIEAALRGQDVLGILPTGAGKSFCFQLPSMFVKGSTVVVSPLIALMQDQTDQMAELGVDAVKLDSTLNAADEREAEANIKDDRELIYITPERLENKHYLDILKSAGVALFVVDEAHCVSQWGHDFRPAYLSLRKAIKELGNPPVMALTATATDDVIDDILKQLAIEDAEIIQFGIERSNLIFEVVPTVNDQAKREALLKILDESRPSDTGIVYLSTVKAADELYQWLCAQGVKAALYHGKLPTKVRQAAQSDFMNDQVRIMVATKAFGLGVNKPNVRFVVHYQFPDSVESYYQEAGRAGRDGESARAVLLYQLEDKRIQSYFLGGKYPSREQSQKVYSVLSQAGKEGLTLAALEECTDVAKNKLKVILAYLEGAGAIKHKRRYCKEQDLDSAQLEQFLSEYELKHASDHDRLNAIMRYGQTMQCRVQFLKNYFGEDDQAICGKCDNCHGQRLTA